MYLISSSFRLLLFSCILLLILLLLFISLKLLIIFNCLFELKFGNTKFLLSFFIILRFGFVLLFFSILDFNEFLFIIGKIFPSFFISFSLDFIILCFGIIFSYFIWLLLWLILFWRLNKVWLFLKVLFGILFVLMILFPFFSSGWSGEKAEDMKGPGNGFGYW